ncbi:hypothetical protein [Pseudovibrio sp. Tun.PSC04-5.I4]|uniref:hypothetical protein n=1 Tax=Pseudovibrio sp. Tun.PSC04-5.I4 TaxID=1798213 RepID=UPI000886CC00|nr:hypothetical protein [Pseudovibrio sp. Tun.PSC04-5.I4]SDR05547.1 hypothetical protein SAMN04515695_2523 [Pseudovibrio sp. Tun.PSC04-5.I4]
MRFLASFLLSMSISTSAFAASDVFLISRGVDDEFIGSHEVQRVPRVGYKELRLCGTSYWVRPFSVAWTKWEKSLGRSIRLEVNQGYGWIVTCKQPTEQVSLQDVGIYASLEETMEQGDPSREVTSRFQAIRRTFILRNGLTAEEAEAELSRTFKPKGSRLSQFLNDRDNK